MKKRSNQKIIQKILSAAFILLACTFAFFAGAKAVQMKSAQAMRQSGEIQEEPGTIHEEQPVTTAHISDALGKAPKPGERVIYLTFDDGPTDNTEDILDVLDEYNVKATFFVIYTHEGCEKEIKEINDRGHQIGLHSYSHSYSIYESQTAYFEDLRKISDLVFSATGMRSRLVRFPGGSSNTISRNYNEGIMTELTQELERRGYAYCDWNADSSDASATVVSAERIVNRSVAYIGQEDPVVLLMHDANVKTTTVEALPEIIEQYRSAGYRFDVLSTESFTEHHTLNN